mmetsp:Transcript_20977/g.35805  ORF Transcript_20977/g.35805 Transcript_20977/m.35805 type:complete len:705 (-) Transcript_20977:159-2273(-)
MADANSAVEALFEDLDKAAKAGQHKKALKIVEQLLVVDRTDEDAHRAKVAALMQLAEWQPALDAIKAANLNNVLVFEQAYCMYRMERLDEGLALLKPLLDYGANTPEAGSQEVVQPALELAAQLHYRQGRSQECIQVYDRLFQQYKADSLQLKSNVLAAYVAAGLSREIPDLMAAMKVSPKDGYEVGYNKACGLLDAGDWSAAETELRMALKRGRETLFEEDYAEAEVDEELAPLSVQLAYALGRQGRGPEAQELYDKVLRGKQEMSDEATRAVAVNNSFADCGRIDGAAANRKTVGGAAKKLEALMADSNKPGSTSLTPGLEARLSGGQKRLLTLNRALTYILSGRVEPARELAAQVARLEAAQPVSAAIAPHLLPLLQAALLVKDGKGAEADELLNAWAAKHSGQSLEPQLARAQLSLEGGQPGAAAAALTAAVSGGSGGAGLLATRVALMQQVGDSAGAEVLLEEALAASRKAGGAGAAMTTWCLGALVSLKLRGGRANEALATYGQLQAAGGGGSAQASALLARLLRAVATTPGAPALASLAKGLPSLEPELRALDLDKLEGAATTGRGSPTDDVPGSSKRAHEAMDTVAEAGPKGKAVRERGPRKKAKRHKRLPKGYNPALPGGGMPPPDPERWLPKWQRSDFKKKKLKSSAREKGAIKGSQGAGKVDMSLDRTTADAGKASGSAKPVLPAKPTKKKRK